jgi:hypothetical protein
VKKEIPDQILKSLKKWDRESSILQFTYAFLGVVSVIAPLIVSAFTNRLGDLPTRVVSLCGAVAVGLIAGFKLRMHANSVRRGFIDLRSAIVEYESCAHYDLDKLVREYIRISKRLGSMVGPDVPDVKSDAEEV